MGFLAVVGILAFVLSASVMMTESSDDDDDMDDGMMIPATVPTP